MAIDTRNKRASAINVSCPWRGMLPEPDSSISAGNRQQLAFMYAFIAEAAAGILAYFGADPVDAIYFGADQVDAAYFGSDPIA